MTTKRTPCSVCGFLHRYQDPLPVGKKAICKNCSSEFVIEQSVGTPDGIKFLTLNVEGGSGITECVGEHYRRKELAELLKKLESNSFDPIAYTVQTCKLIPETNNPHDSNAVRVEIGGCHVAYLPRREAAWHREYLNSIGKPLWRMNVDGTVRIHWEDGDGGPFVESFDVVLKVSWSDA